MIQDTGYGAFVFFAVFSGLAGIWAYFFVPETRGRSLEGEFLDRQCTDAAEMDKFVSLLLITDDRLFKSDSAGHDEAQRLGIIGILCGGHGYSKTRSGNRLRQSNKRQENWVEHASA